MASEDKPKEHYTATIEVTKTTDSYQPKNPRGYEEGKRVDRKVREVARIIVRGDDLDQLKAKLSKHIELIED